MSLEAVGVYDYKWVYDVVFLLLPLAKVVVQFVQLPLVAIWSRQDEWRACTLYLYRLRCAVASFS